MTGQVLDYSIQTNEGIISGDDNQRYRFAGADWPGAAVPTRGTLVDFDIAEGNRAVSIYLIDPVAPPVSQPTAPPAVPPSAPPPTPQSAPTPTLTPAAATSAGSSWHSGGFIGVMTSKRITNALLWGGLAAFLLGMTVCTSSTCAGAAMVFDADSTVQDVERAGSAAAAGQVIFVLGILAAITGAAGKVIASIRSRED